MATTDNPPVFTSIHSYGLTALPALAKSPLNFFIESQRQHGGMASLNLGPTRLLLIHHPDLVQHVLQDNWRNYGKGSMWVAIRKLVGNGLLGSEGEYWLRQRRLMQPMFHRQKLAALTTIMTDVVAAMLDEWKQLAAAGKPVEIAEAMSVLTMQIIVKTMFGTGITPDETRRMVEAYTKALRLMNVRMWTFFLPDFIPLPGDGALREVLHEIDETVHRFIRERRGNPQATDDLLGLLLEMQDADNGERMTDDQVRDEVFTIFLAGHETSATVLSWVWHLIWQHPDVEQKLQQEVDHVLEGRAPTFEDIPHLTYTRAIIDEALRMYPPAWLIPRTAVEDDIIGGIPVKAGTTILISPYVVHRYPEYWQDPERFDPERFSAPGTPTIRAAYIPFGEGPRLCMGNSFALMEMQIIAAMIAQSWHLSLQPGIDIKPTTMPVLRPDKPLTMNLTARLST